MILRPFLALYLALLPLAGTVHAAADASPRERILFTEGWRFQKGDPSGTGDSLSYAKLKPWLLPTANAFTGTIAQRPEGEEPGQGVTFAQPGFDDAAWRQLTLPHDWGIEGPFDQNLPGETGKLPWFGVAWYRKAFDLPATDQGRQLFLEIEGAMAYSAVWCNGHFVGGWPYGYASYRVDLTPYVKAGARNVLAIRLDNPQNSSRWYPGGGIYRNVWLEKTALVHIGQWGVQVRTLRVENEEAVLKVLTDTDNQSNAAFPYEQRVAIHELSSTGNKSAKPVAEIVNKQSFASGAVYGMSSEYSINIPHPKLWSTEEPNLYVAHTTLEQNGKVIDAYDTVFGIRTAEFTVDDGFHLNGKRVQLNGVCMHHDLGALGTAFNVRAAERQLQLLKEMGVNALRTSHNPPAPELLDLCDRMGILVMDEFVDCWKVGKKPNGYNVLFPDWSQADLRAMVRRDRNHPSVILWSVGNEIPEQGRPEGSAMEKQLSEFVHKEDPTRPTTIAASDVKAGYNGFQTGVDVFGYNYKPYEYGKFRAANPKIPIFSSESASTVSSRGEYFFPASWNRTEGKSDFQVSSYDYHVPSWATLPDDEFKGQEQNPFVAGEFVWTGFDYLGEPTPYNSDSTNLLNYHTPEAKAKAEAELKALGKIRVPSRSSYFGILDLAGFKKDRFYLYQAHWRPELPMAHILPHWTWPERVGQVTPVFVYTSGDEAELFLNGKSLGRKKKGQLEYRLRWDEVKYEAGELKVVAYKAGQQWAEDSVKTAGAAAKLTLVADRSTIGADGKDLAFVTATIVDKDGQPVPRSNQKLTFTVNGPGEIAATDNGDAIDHTVFSSPERAAYNGMALAIVRAKSDQAGEITVAVKGEGITPAEVTLQSTAP